MVKRIENPVREGEISRIFFLAYPKFVSGYDLSKIIGKDSKEGWIYRIINQYRDLFEVKEDTSTKRTKKFIRSKAKYLINEMSKEHQVVKQKFQESDVLVQFFNHEFREFCDLYWNKNKERILEEGKDGFSLFKDAYSQLMQLIYIFRPLYLLIKPHWESVFDERLSFLEFVETSQEVLFKEQSSYKPDNWKFKEIIDFLPKEVQDRAQNLLKNFPESVDYLVKILKKYNEKLIEDLIEMSHGIFGLDLYFFDLYTKTAGERIKAKKEKEYEIEENNKS